MKGMMMGGHKVYNEEGEAVLAWKVKAKEGYVLFERLTPEGNKAVEVLRITANLAGFGLFDVVEVIAYVDAMEKAGTLVFEEDITFPCHEWVSGRLANFTIALHREAPGE